MGPIATREYLLRAYARAEREAVEAERMGWEVELAFARGRQEMAQEALYRLFNVDDPKAHLQVVG